MEQSEIIASTNNSNSIVLEDLESISMVALESLVKEQRYKFYISTPDGIVPIDNFIYNGLRECLLIKFIDKYPSINNKLSCTRDHLIKKNNTDNSEEWAVAATLLKGDEVVSEFGSLVIDSIENIGLQKVYDLTINNENHRFFADSIEVHNCGACDTKESISSVSAPRSTKERGDKNLAGMDKISKPNDTVSKLLVEVSIEEGKYGAITPAWLRYAINRAVALASEFRFVKSNIFERYSNSRQPFNFKNNDFKSMISGKFIHEMSYNLEAHMVESDVENMKEKINKYVTPGWKVTNMRMATSDFILKKSMGYMIIEYRFNQHTRPNITLDFLSKNIEAFHRKNIKVKSHKYVTRFISKMVALDFEKNQVLALTAGQGRSVDESVLKIITKVDNTHPLLLLSGILGSVKNSPRMYSSLYGTQISILGHYLPSSALGNVFDSINGSEEDSSTKCPSCDGTKLINLMSGLPFGNTQDEQDPLLLKKYNNQKVCQHCYIEGTN